MSRVCAVGVGSSAMYRVVPRMICWGWGQGTAEAEKGKVPNSILKRLSIISNDHNITSIVRT